MQIAKQSVDAYIECKVAKNLVQSALGKRHIIIKLKMALYALKSNHFCYIINSALKTALQSIMVADIPKVLFGWIILHRFYSSVKTEGIV